MKIIKKNLKFLFVFSLFVKTQPAFFDSWTNFNNKNKSDLWKKITGKELQWFKKRPDIEIDFSLPKFSDVAGGVPQEFIYLKEQMKNGRSIPKGILLQGPPGTGKTHLVKAFAGETYAKIFNVSASQLMGGFVGDGPRNVKSAFDQARAYINKTKLPAIIFFDEFDAIGKRYESDVNAAVAQEAKKTINELLAQMDGFDTRSKIIVIGATNQPDLIDEALKRPGRIDFIISVDLPDKKKRMEIFKYYIDHGQVRNFLGFNPLDQEYNFEDLNIEELADLTGGLNCAELKQLIIDASLKAKARNRDIIFQEDFREAILDRKKIKKIDFKEQAMDEKRITFKDIIGGVPQEILDLKAFLENDDALTAVGAARPSGILMVGPPGTGKTMLARAVAGEIDAAFLCESASSFMEIYIGTGPKKVRDLFDKARKILQDGSAKKVIIFLDEIDAIGNRSAGYAGASEENRTITELLTQMDGFKKNDNIVVLAATNRPELLDSALKRPGRFDYIIKVPLPDFQKRIAILNHYIFAVPRNVSLKIDLNDLALKTEGFNCAELKDLVNRSAINAVRNNRRIILNDDLLQSLQAIKDQRVP